MHLKKNSTNFLALTDIVDYGIVNHVVAWVVYNQELGMLPQLWVMKLVATVVPELTIPALNVVDTVGNYLNCGNVSPVAKHLRTYGQHEQLYFDLFLQHFPNDGCRVQSHRWQKLLK